MTLIVVALVALNVVTILAAFGALRWQSRAHARESTQHLVERKDLLDRCMYLAEKPWAAPEYVRDEDRDVDQRGPHARLGIVPDPENVIDHDHYDVPLADVT